MQTAIDPELRPDQAIDILFAGDQDKSFEGRYLLTDVMHDVAEDGLSTTTLQFASKPLAESRDVTIEEVKPPDVIGPPHN